MSKAKRVWGVDWIAEGFPFGWHPGTLRSTQPPPPVTAPTCNRCHSKARRSVVVHGLWSCTTCGVWIDANGEAYVPAFVEETRR